MMAAPRTRCPRVLSRIAPVLVLSPFIAAAAVRPLTQGENPPSLAEILEKAAAYCRLFESASFNYVCVEDFREVIYSPPLVIPYFPTVRTKIVRTHLVFDYQLVGVKGNISEQRKLLEESVTGRDTRAEPSEIGRFIYRYIILGPVILSEDRQPFHDYKIMGRGKVGNKRCTILEAVPKPSAPPGNLFGKVWVEEHEGRVLKLEWYQESIQNYDIFVATGAALKAKPRIGLTMEYLLEKNGIAFPSRCRISENYITNATARLLTVSETTVTYRNYKFFTVETEVQTGK